MTESARKWIDASTEYADLYELVGLARFHPERSEVLTAIRAASREIVRWQGNNDRRIANRAAHLLKELGRAEAVFSNDGRFSEYRAELMESIRTAAQSPQPGRMTDDELRTWLAEHQRVHADALDEVLAALKSRPKHRSVFSQEGAVRFEESSHSVAETNEVKGEDTQDVARKRRIATPVRPRSRRVSEEAVDAACSEKEQQGLVALEAVAPRETVPAWACVAGGVILLVLLIDLAWMFGMFSGAESNRSVVETGPEVTGSDSATPEDADDPPVSTLESSAVSPAAPAASGRLPSDSRIDPPRWRIDEQVTWSGVLESAQGVGGPPAELHLLITSKQGDAAVPRFEALVADPDVIEGLSDYLSSVEHRLDYERDTDGDTVQVTGVVVSATSTAARIAPPTVPLLRLSSIQRADEPESLVQVGQPPRTAGSFREDKPVRNLRTLIRMAPPVGARISVQGVFRDYDERHETVFVAPATGPRGVEVYFNNRSFDAWTSGDAAEVTGTFQGNLMTRRIPEGIVQRPIIIGMSMQNSGESSSGPIPDAADDQGSDTKWLRFRGTALLVGSEDGTAAVYHDDSWFSVRLEGRTPGKLQWCHVDRNQNCWLCGEGGVTRLDGNAVQVSTTSDGIPGGQLNHVFEDSRGRIWVSTENSGVAVLSDDRWVVYRADDGLRPGVVNVCVEDRFERIWALGEGVSVFQNGTFEGDELGPRFVLPPVMSAETDRHGRVYFGCIGGLLRLDGAIIEQVTTEDGLPQRTPQAVFVDSQNRIWAGTWGGGAVRLSEDDLKVQTKDMLPGNLHIARFCEDAAGDVWAATMEGLWRFDNNGWERVRTPDVIARVRVVATVPDIVAEQLVSWTGGSRLSVDRQSTTLGARQDQPRGPLEFVGIQSPLTNRMFRIRRGVERNLIQNSLGAPQAEGRFQFADRELTIAVYICPERGNRTTIVLVGYDEAEKVNYVAAERGIPDSDDVLKSNVIVDLVEDYESAFSSDSGGK